MGKKKRDDSEEETSRREERGPGGKTNIGEGKKEKGKIEGEGREKEKGKERRKWLGSCERKRGKLKRREEMMRKGELRERKETVKWKNWRQSLKRKKGLERKKMHEIGMVTPLHRKGEEGMILPTQKTKRMNPHLRRKARRKEMIVKRRHPGERAKNPRRELRRRNHLKKNQIVRMNVPRKRRRGKILIVKVRRVKMKR